MTTANNDAQPVGIESMTVRYGRNVALDSVSLAIEPGTVYALLGRNGAGKSSLIRCLLGQQKPQRGEARLFGANAWRHRADLMRRVGVVPEVPDAPPEMTPGQILRFAARLYPNWNDADAHARLKRFDVPLTTPFGRLSKGQKRQVLLAVALANSPALLVLDDPTLGLDVVARKELFEELIADLADRGTTVFITTHDLPGIESIADRVGILRAGRFVLDEDLETLKWRFRRLRFVSPVTLDADERFEPLRAVSVRSWGHGVEAVVERYDEVALERFRGAADVRDVEVAPMSLEEIFIAVSDSEKGVPS